jgi:hypothetical protein
MGKIVRLSEFNSPDAAFVKTAYAPANWLATDKLFEQWYQNYCSQIQAVR